MKFVLLWCTLLGSTAMLFAQNQLIVIVKDAASGEPLAGASATIGFLKTGLSGTNGVIQLNDISNGRQTIRFSFTGYQDHVDTLIFPYTDTLQVLLQPTEEELDDVVVSTTRTGRSIRNTPTWVEVIDAEEVDEKNNMRPANVSMLLHESTGLQVQQTSATSASASIRVQGLDGRYTQLLKDGYPNFGNFASGLSILEIPPLDLQQVEVIKGPASTLYGGGAIAGVINFISKMPKEKAEYDLLLNQSNIGQTNVGGYASQRFKKLGYSLLALGNLQKPYDVDGDHFTELPRNNSFTIHPRLFFYPNKKTTLMLGNAFTKGNILGGDLYVIHKTGDAGHTYFEENKTVRNNTTLEAQHHFNETTSLKWKQSLGLFDRKIAAPGYRFDGFNINSFTDLSFVTKTSKQTLITGINVVWDNFKQRSVIAANRLDAQIVTLGGYAQHTWDLTDKVKLESGLRIDHVQYENVVFSRSQTFVLPRLSALFVLNNYFSSRIGGGLGYKVPTIFTEQTETLLYQHVQPLRNVTSEKSIGGTADINYRGIIGKAFRINLNHLFFITQINKPLVLQGDTAISLNFVNAARPVRTTGFETNLRLIYQNDLKLFAGYTYTHAVATYKTTNQFLPLLPRHKLNLALIYEKEQNFKLGMEAYYTGKQFLYSGQSTPSFWEIGFMAEKTIGKVSLFINFENITDQRQSRYKRVVGGTDAAPTFDEIWNHVEGRTINGGIKLKL